MRWGKKNKADDFGSFATNALLQMMEGIYKTGVAPEHLLATDGVLHGYIGKAVEWEQVWAAAAQHYEPFGGVGAAMLNVQDAYQYAGGRTTVLQFGSLPYWLSEPQETKGVAPLSVMAFLGVPHRMRVAQSSQAEANILDIMAGGKGSPGDGDGRVRTAAVMNLVKRGLRTLNY